MNLLFMTDRYPPYYEGAYELNCAQVADGLRTRGHTVRVLTTAHGLAQPHIEGEIFRVLHTAYRHYRSAWHRRLFESRDMFARRKNYRLTRHLLCQLQPDLVFVWQMDHASIQPILAAQDAGIPTAFRVGSHWLVNMKQAYADDPGRLKRYYRTAMLGFRRFESLKLGPAIMVSDSLLETHRRAGFDVTQAEVIPTGVPEHWVAVPPAARPANPEGWRLLFAGRLEHEKGPQVALEALARLIRMPGCARVSLDLVGRGEPPDMDRLHQLVTGLGLNNHVRFLGFLPRETLLAHYSNVDILLFTSLRLEGFPTTILEAMAKGIAVVASNIGGPRDVIIHEHNGLLVPSGLPDALANAVALLMRRPAFALKLGREAIKTILRHHTFLQMLDRYEAFLSGVLAPTSGPEPVLSPVQQHAGKG